MFFHRLDDGFRIQGCTTAVEDGATWIVDYEIVLDATWTTRSAQVCGRSAAGTRSAVIEAAGAGRWRVDGTHAPHLDGCLDVGLESSAMTNWPRSSSEEVTGLGQDKFELKRLWDELSGRVKLITYDELLRQVRSLGRF